jgi:hypothetical protein
MKLHDPSSNIKKEKENKTIKPYRLGCAFEPDNEIVCYRIIPGKIEFQFTRWGMTVKAVSIFSRSLEIGSPNGRQRVI